MRVKLTPAWKPMAFGSSLFLFIVAFIGCAVRGWHAPRELMLAVIYLLGVMLGIALTFNRARAIQEDAQAFDEEVDVVEIRSSRMSTLGLAAIIGAITGLGGAVVLATLMADWTALVLASIVGSLYMASYPLHILGAHVVLEKKLRLGMDGLRIGRRVIAFRSMRSAVAKGDTLHIQCDDDQLVRHRCATPDIAKALAIHIAPKISANENAAAKRVGREGRSLEAWKRELLAPDYRSSEISSEDAKRILHAGGASPEERVGAALVLASRAEDGERERIRIAAAACVDPRLRVALERVADDTIDDVTVGELEPKRMSAR